ncbi:acid phosphatase [Rickenella mellea]|uniref:Acid phosphatase n=1 Tax=Rickenella mellea TaxID=50990 RepID=A0A4R5XDW0_9AGAM|nr:acid phosphatase [Rickenella mellea]
MHLLRLQVVVAAALVSLSGVSGQTKLLLTNDDGWAVGHIRAFFNLLDSTKAFSLLLSAPAQNESGTGSLDLPAGKVGSGGCEFSSCPGGAPAEGSDPTDARLNYVNSYPVTSVKFGIQTLASKVLGGKPDLVLSGPNVGGNTGVATFFSGTVGAATEAAKEGIPALAISGASGSQVSFTTLSTPSDSTTASNVYAALSIQLTQALLASPSPILPNNTVLNVNYPATTGACTSASAFKFVLTRIYDATIFSGPDASWCGVTRLPTETNIVGRAGCLASVSVMGSNKLDVSAATQQIVAQKLSNILSCV